MQQFVVPQFIDVEDKIFGPISVRQFLIIMGALIATAISYQLFNFITFLLVAIVLLGSGAVVAFLKINGQPFHFFLLSLIQTIRRPRLKIWSRHLASFKPAPAPPIVTPSMKPVRHALPPASRLSQLALLVDTGGAWVEAPGERLARQSDRK